MNKKLDITELIGHTIKSYTKDGNILTTNGKSITIQLEDDSAGGNDSHAFFEKFDLDSIIGEEIVSATEYNHPRTDGAILTIKTANNVGIIEIIHDSNGWYGWGYEVFIK